MNRNKAPPEQASMFDVFAQAETDRRTAHLPATIPEAAAHLRALFARLDAALRAGDGAAAAGIEQEAEDLAIKLNGGTHFGMCTEGGGAVLLEEATRAPDGEVPLWGQQGCFDVDVAGRGGTRCRVRIAFDGLFGMSFLAFSAGAVHWDLPFISQTGYRSFLGPPRALAIGISVQDYVRRTLDAYVASALKGVFVPIRAEHRERNRLPASEPQP